MPDKWTREDFVREVVMRLTVGLVGDKKYWGDVALAEKHLGEWVPHWRRLAEKAADEFFAKPG
jgi:hypothetical protein